jgi:hypothetical protein
MTESRGYDVARGRELSISITYMESRTWNTQS